MDFLSCYIKKAVSVYRVKNDAFSNWLTEIKKTYFIGKDIKIYGSINTSKQLSIRFVELAREIEFIIDLNYVNTSGKMKEEIISSFKPDIGGIGPSPICPWLGTIQDLDSTYNTVFMKITAFSKITLVYTWRQLVPSVISIISPDIDEDGATLIRNNELYLLLCKIHIKDEQMEIVINSYKLTNSVCSLPPETITTLIGIDNIGGDACPHNTFNTTDHRKYTYLCSNPGVGLFSWKRITMRIGNLDEMELKIDSITIYQIQSDKGEYEQICNHTGKLKRFQMKNVVLLRAT